ATTLDVHGIEQKVISHSLDEPVAREWVSAAVQLLNTSFPTDSDDLRTWATYQGLLPHVLAVAEHAQRMELQLDAAGRLLDRAGIYLLSRGQYAQARLLLEQAVNVGEGTLGVDHPDVAAYRNDLGAALYRLGDLDGARKEFERALAITEAALGADHPHVATPPDNLCGRVSALR